MEEYDKDISFGKRVFCEANTEFKNHSKRISGWRKILLKEAQKTQQTQQISLIFYIKIFRVLILRFMNFSQT